jgi:hypothetical protein
MDTLLTVVGLLVLAAWAVLWVLTSAALMAHEPKPERKRLDGSKSGSFRPVGRAR